MGAVNSAAAIRGRVMTRPSVTTQRGRSNARAIHDGVPYRSSGGNTSVSSRCCAMCALNR